LHEKVDRRSTDQDLKPSTTSQHILDTSPGVDETRARGMNKSMGHLDATGGVIKRASVSRESEGGVLDERPWLLRTHSGISSLGFSEARKKKSTKNSLDSTGAKASSQLSLEDDNAPVPTAIIVVVDEARKETTRVGEIKLDRKQRWMEGKSTVDSRGPKMTLHSSFGSLEDVPTRQKHTPEERLHLSLGAYDASLLVASPQYRKIKETLRNTLITEKARAKKLGGAPLTDGVTEDKPKDRGDVPRWMKRQGTHSLLSDFATGPSPDASCAVQDNSRKLLLELTEQKMKQEPLEKFWTVLSEAFQPTDIDSVSYSGLS
jgi:hypothetical protein